MQNRVIGINYKTAGLSRVAQLQFRDPADVGVFLSNMRQKFRLHEAFFLQTCNRREFYLLEQDQQPLQTETLIEALNDALGADFDREDFFELSGESAVRHLFRVASSLESMVLGETEITKQVKIQSRKAIETGCSGKYMRAWVDEALRAAKRIRSETEITKNVISMASLASRFTGQHLNENQRSTVAFVGAGHYMHSILPHFSKMKDADFLFVNRTPNSALADRYGGHAMDLATFLEQAPEFDVMVTATAATEPIFSRRWMKDATQGRPVLVLDLALPCDVDKKAAELEHIELVGLEDMEQMLERNRTARKNELPKTEPILDEGCSRLASRWLEYDLSIVHQEIAKHYRQTGDRALDFLFKDLPPELINSHGDQLRDWASDLVSRLVHVPVLGLKGVVDEYGTPAVSAYTKRISAKTPMFRGSDSAVG